MYNITLLSILVLNINNVDSINKRGYKLSSINILSNFRFTRPEIDRNLIGFHVNDCEYCQEMSLLIEQLEREYGIRVNILDANEEGNLKLLKRLDTGKCGGLPFYYNLTTNRYICGATSYENFLVWAKNGINKTHMPPMNNEIKEHKKYRSLGLMVRLIRWLNESLDVNNSK